MCADRLIRSCGRKTIPIRCRLRVPLRCNLRPIGVKAEALRHRVVATIKATSDCGEHDAVLAAVKTWPGGGGDEAKPERRPALTAAARGVVVRAGRDEETVLRPNKETRSGGGGTRDFGRFGEPRGCAGDDGVDDDEQLPGTGDERALVALAGGDQAAVQGHELRVPAEGCRQCGGIERPAQAFAAAFDVTDA